MKLLYVTTHEMDLIRQESLWRFLNGYEGVSFEVFQLDHRGYSNVSNLYEFLQRKKTAFEKADLIFGQYDAFLNLSLMRSIGISSPWIIIPDCNPVTYFDFLQLAIGSQQMKSDDLLLCGCEDTALRYAEFGWNTVADYAPGILNDVFCPYTVPKCDLKNRLGLNSSQFHILYTGRGEAKKNVLELAKAVSSILPIRDVQLITIFSNDEPELVNECRSILGDSNFFAEANISPTRLADFYRASDLFVTLSLSPFETFGRSVVESMACGTPAAAFRYNGFKSTITDQSGYFLKHAGKLGTSINTESIGQQILSILVDIESRQKKATVCIEESKRHHLHETLTRFIHYCDLSTRRTNEKFKFRKSFSVELMPKSYQPILANLEKLDNRTLIDRYFVAKFVDQRKPEILPDNFFHTWFLNYLTAD